MVIRFLAAKYLCIAIVFSASVQAEVVKLEEHEAWTAGQVTLHKKCYKFYRDMILDVAYKGKKLTGDDLVIVVDELSNHRRASFAFFKDIDHPNGLFIGNMASQFDNAAYDPYRANYPQLKQYFDWQPSLDKCLEIAGPNFP